MSEQAKATAGWYPRPDMTGTLGYWDGERWGEQIAPLAPAPEPIQRGDVVGEVAGWIGIFIFPILGIIIGILLLSKGHGRGAAMLVLSIVTLFIGWRMLANGY